MRVQLIPARARGALVAALAAVVAVAVASVDSAPARAEDRVTVRGAYYREASTRVVQPVVEIAKDLPHGFDVNAHYLMDAITSASVAAGTIGDAIFTEVRNEAGLAAGWTGDRARVILAYRYSAESDYWSHGLGASGALRLWGDSATLVAALGVSFDGAWPRTRTPDCPTAMELICRLRNYFGSVGYTQVWTPTLVTQLGLELEYLDGFQASLYRAVPNLGPEKVPSTRLRVVLGPRVAYYLPNTQTGLQLQYRYYRDDWSVSAHMVEGRVFETLSRDLELRVSLRYYTQTPADFWCNWMAHPDCYPAGASVYTGDPKLQPVTTWMPEVKLMWDALRLRGVPFLGWFAEGTFEISYARYIQNTIFGDAHLVQMGYTLPY